MSYDLMVFEPTVAPTERSDFMEWYGQQTAWAEGHDYNTPSVASLPLQNWFSEMIRHFPPLNGPYASDDVDDPKVTDYSIGYNLIYAAFSWSCAEDAYTTMKELAIKHNVGFFNISDDNGEIVFPA